jgi:hypothetical protein
MTKRQHGLVPPRGELGREKTMAEQKTTEEVCAYCGEELGEIPIRRGKFVYCSEACAFEASRSVDCGGRTDTHSAPPIVEQIPPPSTE